MKELLESKGMLGFAILILGFVFLNCGNDINLEEKEVNSQNSLVMVEIN